MKRPVVQRTNGSWYHLLVRRRPAPIIPAAVTGDALSARYRAPPALLASYVRAAPTAGLSASRLAARAPLSARRLGRYSSRSSP